MEIACIASELKSPRGTQEAGASAAEVMTSSEQSEKQSEDLQAAVAEFPTRQGRLTRYRP